MPKRKIRPGIEKLPPYVPGKTPEDNKVIKLASNENPLGPSPLAMEAIQKALKDAHIYPDQYSLMLKETLSRKLKLSPNNLIIGNGSDEIMQFVAAAFLNAKEEVVISKNTFSTYEFVTRLFDGSPIFINTKDYAYDLDTMAKAVGLNTKLVFLCSPNSPTGTIITKNKMDPFLKKLPKGVIAIIDEAYSEYVESPDYPDSLEYVRSGMDVVVLRTFSKLYGLAGLRVGYGIARPELINYLNMVKLPFNVNRLAQAAAAAALGDSQFIGQSLANNRIGKTYLYRELEKLGLDFVKTEANFILINANQPADETFLKMMRLGVIIRPLTSFGLPNSIRVTIGTPEQNEKFVDALKKAIK